MTTRSGRFVRPDVLGLLLLVLALPGGWADARAFLACWLTAWWFVLGLMLGSLANLWIHRLTGGLWGELLRRAGLDIVRRLPLALLLFLPLLVGLQLLYPWAGNPQGWARALSKPAFATAWLQPGFVMARLACYAAIWWGLSRHAPAAGKGLAAASLLLYLLSGTLAAVDLLMSLVPGWYSAAFGLVVLSGQALGGAALCTLWLAWRMPLALAEAAPRRPPPARDLGNLLLMWLLIWAYLAFMEFLIIWSEDLPHETAWYLPRLQTGWAMVGVALVLGQLVLPLLALLQRRLKDRPPRLAWMAGGLVLTQLLNSAWLVLPSVDPHSTLGWWLVPQLALGMGLLLWGAGTGPSEHLEVRHATP